MAGMSTSNMDALTRSELWSKQLKSVLYDELMGMGYVNWLSEFPDGSTFTIPSIGEATVRDYVEDTPIIYDALDTGEFQLTITEYLSSATYITEKAKQDSYYMNQLTAAFVPKMQRALSEKLETDILALAKAGASGGQTISVVNAINGADHRFVASGTNQTITVQDFAKALYALKKANVPQTNLIAIVDPSVEYTLNTLTNIVNISNNPRWEGLVTTGIATGMRFIKNIYGFDVYTSNYLPDAGLTGSETIDSVAVSNGKCNIFFSAAGGDVNPFIGAWRQMPKVDGEYNKDFQRDEYLVTARYGLKVYRQENLVVIPSDTTQV